ncbi:hypothetical protein EIP91_003846 [Steccherinum ochraceum]|uniref:Uncharacterized protein n=1 Tax=Steccherinum ochraceum TaxID=92696 RepID=A0A4R0RB49_9APHY|nr:hypothetical protein EIP91_003846 [Steccherinum ochraceum]
MRFTTVVTAAALVAAASTAVLAAPVHALLPSVQARDGVDFLPLLVRDVTQTLNELGKRAPKGKASTEARPALTPEQELLREAKKTRKAMSNAAMQKWRSDTAAAKAMGLPEPPRPPPIPPPPRPPKKTPAVREAGRISNRKSRKKQADTAAAKPAAIAPVYHIPDSPTGPVFTHDAPGDDLSHVRPQPIPDQPTIDPSVLKPKIS